MKIGVLGTGTVGRTMAARFAGLGHDVTIGTRDPATTAARTEPDAMGNPPFSAWAAEHPEVKLGTFAEAAVQGEIVVNATGGVGSIDALTLAAPITCAARFCSTSPTRWTSRGAFRRPCRSRTPTHSASRFSGPSPTHGWSRLSTP